uniref:Uncharacterized protein n=1 Tax=Petunia integrifolia subsp. inflata TaxID=212142 RepID=A9XLF5_PETIN|nr:unknown [Petunia integrifolia subsp. inflata]
MKVPFSSNDNVSSKPLNNSNNNNLRNSSFPAATNSPNLCYEPKSVLELRRSPSPILDNKQVITNPDYSTLCGGGEDPLQLGDHVLSNFEDWDSLMRELGLQEDSASLAKSNPQLTLTQTESLTQFHTLSEYSADSAQFGSSEFSFSENYPHQFPAVNQGNYINALDLATGDNNNWNLGFDYVDELIRFAECFETNAFQLAHVILARLNQRLRSASGKPLQRAAFYFKEALQAQLAGSTRQTRPSSSSDVIQTIKSYKIFSNISPIPMFSSFTANQAVLEAVDGSMLVHVIDFDIGLGGHWASFMKELADKAESRKAVTPVFRITALVPEEYAVESRLIRENLTQFARELNIGFEIDFVLIRTFELLSFKSIKFMDGEKTAVLLSPAIFRRVGSGFVSDLRRVNPNVVVHVDSEGLMGYGTVSFRQTVIDGLEFYSTLLESLEAANIGGGNNCGDWMRKIESFVLFPKIVELVAAIGRRNGGGGGGSWKEAVVAAGFRPVGLSQFADFQADCLLGRVQVRGFHVAKRQAEMLLCWHDRALVATSAWRCS